MPDLYDTVPLETSTRYTNRMQVGQLLPDAYGDLRYGGEGGLMECVYIDTVAANPVHLCANHAVESINDLWDRDGNLLTAGADYVATISGDYGGLGKVISYVEVSKNVNPPFYWRGKGKLSGGVLITNPISAWQDFLTTRAGWVAADFDSTLLEAARTACTAQSYKFARWIHEERTAKGWLTEWCGEVLADHWLDRDGKLRLLIDTGVWLQERDLAMHLIATRDVVDGEDGVEMVGDTDNLMNDLRQYHLYHYRRMDFSSLVNDTSLASQGIFGIRTRALNRMTIRDTTHLDNLATVLLDRFDGRVPTTAAILRFSTVGLRCAHLTPGDKIGFSWDHGPARSGDQYLNRILKILNVETQLPGGPITIEALDIGQRLNDDYYFDADGGPNSGYYNAAYYFGGDFDSSVHP